jgi:Rrf2 family protein
MMFSSREV